MMEPYQSNNNNNMLLWKSYPQALLNCSLSQLDSSTNSNDSLLLLSSSIDIIESLQYHQHYQLNVTSTSPLPLCDPIFIDEMRQALMNTFDNQSQSFLYGENSSNISEIDLFEANRFFIKHPHDMLHPTQINPCKDY